MGQIKLLKKIRNICNTFTCVAAVCIC